ncbi:MAG TPA: AraC family transcriptional regulator [Chryseosolibacter sp.]
MDLYARIVRAKLFIDEHYSSPIDLETLSSEACFSKYHFLRLFKRTYNKTPYQYLSEIRIEKAKQKLKAHVASISEVCEDVGFESNTSFTAKFKEYTGETPAVFRLRAMQTQHLVKTQPTRFIPNCFSSQFSPEE